MGDVFDRIHAAADRLTAAERKVAASITDDPQAVAFGTVAEIASRSGSSGASVVRLATKLGYRGFSDLQAAVRPSSASTAPATERIHDPHPGDLRTGARCRPSASRRRWRVSSRRISARS